MHRFLILFLTLFLVVAEVHADDLYLKNGILYTNVIVVDTSGMVVTILRDSVRMNIQTDLIEKIEQRKYIPGEHSLREVYSQSKADEYADNRLQNALLHNAQDQRRNKNHTRWIKDSAYFQDRTVTIEFKDGHRADAGHFMLGRDSCRWTDLRTGVSVTTQTQEIKLLITSYPLLGGLQGFCIGVLGGGATGGLLGFALSRISSGSASQNTGGGREDASGIGAGVGMAAGVIIGGVIGTVRGADPGYQFEYEANWFVNE
ncbi:MAG: hypothetical protein WCW40_02745 [Bacteroidota bacterium]